MDSLSNWRELALCKNMNTNLFFELYQENEESAKKTDDLCLACPVRNNCLLEAVQNGETGCHGSVFLTKGNYSRQFNRHKDKSLASGLQSQVAAYQKLQKAADD